MFRKGFIQLLLCLVGTICTASAAIVDTVGVGESGVKYSVANKPGSTYQWFVTGGNIVYGNGQNRIVVDWGKKFGYYQVCVVEISKSGCVGDTVKQDVYIELPKFPLISGKEKICFGESIILEASGADSIYKDISYKWITGETSQQIFVTPLKSTSYFCVVFYNGDAVDTAFFDVEVFPYPKPTFNWIPSKPKVGDEISISYTGGKFENIAWYFNGVKDTSQFLNYKKVIDSIGYLDVQLIAYNEIGCSELVQHRIFVEGESEILVPEVFSPNADGNNDVFVIDFPMGMQKIKTKIYNRWGNLVISSNDAHFEWDGTMLNNEVPDGAYVIYIEAYNASGKYITYDKTIVLLR